MSLASHFLHEILIPGILEVEEPQGAAKPTGCFEFYGMVFSLAERLQMHKAEAHTWRCWYSLHYWFMQWGKGELSYLCSYTETYQKGFSLPCYSAKCFSQIRNAITICRMAIVSGHQTPSWPIKSCVSLLSQLCGKHKWEDRSPS
jgi:hypothetical protein